MSFRPARLIAAAAALLLAGQAGAADRTVAVLSSAGGAYMEAFSAFQADYGAVAYFDLSKDKVVIPPGTRTIVAFGAKAAAQPYPPDADLVYAMAPGYLLNAAARPGRTVKISMRVSPQRLLEKLLQIQPELRRLRIFWTSPSYSSFQTDYPAAAARLGMQVNVVRVESADHLPALLRDALDKADAFWLPPDPLLISPETLMLFKQFSWNNSVPMYGTTKGLAREGACAAVGVSFAQAGTAAAGAAKRLRAGEDLPQILHPDELELTLNASAAKRCGVSYSEAILREADYLYP